MMGGGVHLAALSIMFPTPIERLLWEIACYSLLGISGCIGICSILVFLVFILDRGYPSRLLENLPRLLLRQGAGSRSSRHRSQHRISTSRKRWMDITTSVVGGFLAAVVVFLMFAVPILFFWVQDIHRHLVFHLSSPRSNGCLSNSETQHHGELPSPIA